MSKKLVEMDLTVYVTKRDRRMIAYLLEGGFPLGRFISKCIRENVCPECIGEECNEKEV